jgi:hypothetical protein
MPGGPVELRRCFTLTYSLVDAITESAVWFMVEHAPLIMDAKTI